MESLWCLINKHKPYVYEHTTLVTFVVVEKLGFRIRTYELLACLSNPVNECLAWTPSVVLRANELNKQTKKGFPSDQ